MGADEMKKTSVSYCQVCHDDFKDKQIVYYVTIDNSIVCSKCADVANTNDIQTRIFKL